MHHLLFLPCWWHFSLRGVGCWDERVGLTEQNLKVSQAAASIHTTGKPLELQQARRSTRITDSNTSQSFCTHRFGVDSSQHPHKAKLKLKIEAVFWHCPRSPGAPASASGRANLQEGVRCGLQRGIAGGDAELLQGGMQAAAALEFSPRRCELIHSSKSSKIICGEYQFSV